jgi:hypothetical protein
VDILLLGGMARDAGGRRGQVGVEDRAELPSLVAVGRLAEQPIPQRRQLLRRRVGGVDGVGPLQP